MGAHIGHPQMIEVVGGNTQCDRIGNIGRARVELFGQRRPGRAVLPDLANHASSAQEWRHLFEERSSTPQHPNTCWPEHLVSRERQEIWTQASHIGDEVRHALRTVSDDDRSQRMRQRRDLAHIRDGAQDVGRVRDRDHTSSRPEQVAEIVHVDGTVGRQPDQPDLRPRLLGYALPRNQVRMVLQQGRQDLIARFQIGSAPAHRHQIQSFGGVAHEDDLFGVFGADEPADPLARALVRVSGFDAQGVHAAVHVGIGGGVEVNKRVDHLTGFLGGGGVVEIDQRPTIDQPLQDREIGADALDIDRRGSNSRINPEHREIIPFWSELAKPPCP